jgi:hypothetical protein
MDYVRLETRRDFAPPAAQTMTSGHYVRVERGFEVNMQFC